MIKIKNKCPTPCDQNNPCVNGNCNNNSPSFGTSSCTCFTGYTGTNCQIGIQRLNIYQFIERKTCLISHVHNKIVEYISFIVRIFRNGCRKIFIRFHSLKFKENLLCTYLSKCSVGESPFGWASRSHSVKEWSSQKNLARPINGPAISQAKNGPAKS